MTIYNSCSSASDLLSLSLSVACLRFLIQNFDYFKTPSMSMPSASNWPSLLLPNTSSSRNNESLYRMSLKTNSIVRNFQFPSPLYDFNRRMLVISINAWASTVEVFTSAIELATLSLSHQELFQTQWLAIKNSLQTKSIFHIFQFPSSLCESGDMMLIVPIDDWDLNI